MHNAKLKHGYDVRDYLSQSQEMSVRMELLRGLLDKVVPIPADWVAGRTASAAKTGGVLVQLVECISYAELRNQWRKVMRWIPGLDKALTVMLATAVSTECVGDQLWVKIVGPPSCGKTTLAEAMAVARKYVKSTDTCSGLVSGYQTDREGSENLSFVKKLNNMTWIVQDGDTLLTEPNLNRILAELRAFYGRVLRVNFKNKMSADHEGYNTTFILLGTESLRQLDSSEMGERMLDCQVLSEMDEDLEREIAMRKSYQAKQHLSMSANGEPESRDDPQMLLTKQMTGGFVEYLRRNAQSLLNCVHMDDEAHERVVDMAMFVSYMRSRPSRKQEESVHRELCFRLVSQFTRLANCIAAIWSRGSVDKECLALAQSVAIDTARGRTLEIARALREAGTEGMEAKQLGVVTGHTLDSEAKYLSHLKRLKAVEVFLYGAGSVRPRWRLTERMTRLFDSVAGGLNA
jgi:hypothetical protein